VRVKLRIALGFAALALVLAGVGTYILTRSPRRLPALPSPNGYEDMVLAGSLLTTSSAGWETQGVAHLRPSVEANSNALGVLRGAWSSDWGVPISPDPNAMQSILANVTTTKRLAQALVSEGRVAEWEGRTNDAVVAYSDCLMLGHKSTHGGLMIHDLVGIACTAIGTKPLQRIYSSVSDNSLLSLLRRLAEIDGNNEPVEDLIGRDRDWARRSHGWLRFAWGSIQGRGAIKQHGHSVRMRHRISESEVRLLRTDVALELFRRKNGRYPPALAELVPEFFNAVPQDPFRSQPLSYRINGESYLLYSVGSDEKDDGGKPAVRRPDSDGSGFAGVPSFDGDLLSTPPAKR